MFNRGDKVMYRGKVVKIISVSYKSGKPTYKIRETRGKSNTISFNISEKDLYKISD